MKGFIASAAVAAAVLAGSPALAQTSGYRLPDVTTLVGPGSSIGVQVRELTADEARTTSGVYIQEVVPDTPAERAGLKAGDVVVEFDGERVRSVRNFTRLVSETPPQRTVKATVVRDGARRSIDVTPERAADRLTRNFTQVLPPDFLQRWAPRRAFPVPPIELGRPRYRGWIGVTLEPIEGQMADYFGVSAGALVSAVDLDSPASRAGLKAGDVITAAGGQTVRGPADVSQAIRRQRPGAKLELKIVRDRKEMTIEVESPAAQSMLLGGRT